MYYRFGDKTQPVNIIIKDSLKIIKMPLKAFGKCFKLDVEKEIMPHQLYTQENLEKVYVPIHNVVPYIDDHNGSQSMSNIGKWCCRGEGHKLSEFNILKYSSKYCDMDCHVLRLGYETLRGWMLNYIGVDVDN